jgi:hypothetical protein
MQQRREYSSYAYSAYTRYPQIVNLEAESMECLLALRDSESGNVAFAILYWCLPHTHFIY